MPREGCPNSGISVHLSASWSSTVYFSECKKKWDPTRYYLLSVEKNWLKNRDVAIPPGAQDQQLIITREKQEKISVTYPFGTLKKWDSQCKTIIHQSKLCNRTQKTHKYIWRLLQLKPWRALVPLLAKDTWGGYRNGTTTRAMFASKWKTNRKRQCCNYCNLDIRNWKN